MTTLQSIIEDAFENRSEITPSTVSSEIKNAVNETMEGLNHGVHRVASRIGNSQDWDNIANTRREVDTLIVCRGGGSIEDLWSFNGEIVANAIFKSEHGLFYHFDY